MLLLREMELKDSAGIAELELEIFSDAWTEKSIRETFYQSHAFIIMAEENMELKGYAIVYHVLDEAEIVRIAVKGSARREGVGTSMLNECERICLQKGAERLLLDVREGNTAAQKFYKKQGFAVDGIRKNFYENPREDAVLMSKAIV